MKILIKNGTVVSPAKTGVLDILISDTLIEKVGKHIAEDGVDTIIDASDLLVFPGCVDPHVHMHLPGPAGFSSDDFYSGSKAALYGGTTTIIDFVTPAVGESLTEALNKRKTEAKRSLIDYTFHVSPVDWRESTANEMEECLYDGITSFKVYMAYKSTIGLDDQALRDVMKVVGSFGATMAVHCELGDEIDNLCNINYYLGNRAPLYHSLSRPASTEAEAVAKAIKIAGETGCRLYIVHLSARESLKYIRSAHNNGQKVFVETCPQYLLLDNSNYKGKFIDSAPYVISPPLRTGEDCLSLWNAIAENTVDTIATDHCPFTYSQKRAGRDDFRKIPGGAGGVEHRLELLYTYGVLEGKMTLNKMVDMCATKPAKIFGLYPRKGEIAAGNDADIVIWNPRTEKTISAKTHHQNCDINIYEGITVKGNADCVIASGQIMIQNNLLTENSRQGCYLRRTVSANG